MSFSVQPVSEALGVEIEGIEPANLSDEDKRAFKRLFDHEHFVLIRNADTTEDAHLALADIIGPIQMAAAIMNDGSQFPHIANVHHDGELPATSAEPRGGITWESQGR